ncbi:hypothetical protein ACFYKX_10080 [Cytobacillus sp. FJAT-54145]|uniref:Uncharacterized protein n=1 Tax=Cytobacillus spartinae TaxID=3299023 RepID=A0ABW6K9R9_9BACI
MSIKKEIELFQKSKGAGLILTIVIGVFTGILSDWIVKVSWWITPLVIISFYLIWKILKKIHRTYKKEVYSFFSIQQFSGFWLLKICVPKEEWAFKLREHLQKNGIEKVYSTVKDINMNNEFIDNYEDEKFMASKYWNSSEVDFVDLKAFYFRYDDWFFLVRRKEHHRWVTGVNQKKNNRDEYVDYHETEYLVEVHHKNKKHKKCMSIKEFQKLPFIKNLKSITNSYFN